jgi:hypothetical protein
MDYTIDGKILEDQNKNEYPCDIQEILQQVRDEYQL